MLANIKIIKNFYSIPLKIRTTVLCDLDDTIFDFKDHVGTYWLDSDRNDPFYERWFSLIKDKDPKPTCEHLYNFLEDIKLTSSSLIFITARNERFKNGTLTHLEKMRIEFENIYFLNGELKGSFIRDFLTPCVNTIFIDDDSDQVNDVAIKNPNLTVYHFKK